MRKIYILILSLCIAVSILTSTAFAAENYELLPVDVIYSHDRMEIRKIYEMAASVNPDMIPREGFERDSIEYECADIIREVVIGDETIIRTETETVDSTKNDIASVLEILPMTKELLTEDGFFGILHLNTSTIKSEVSGYGTTSSTVTVTRSYPNLSDADSQYIPKEVTDGGITYTLSDIQWNTDNRYNEDDYEIGNRYTALATYSGTKSSSYVKGYKITAEYTGDLCRTGVTVIRYTVIFSGVKLEPISTAEPETTEDPNAGLETDPTDETTTEQNQKNSSGFNWLIVVIPLALLTAGSIGGVIYMYLKNKKEQDDNEKIEETEEPDETFDYGYAGDFDDDSDGDPDDGSGL